MAGAKAKGRLARIPIAMEPIMADRTVATIRSLFVFERQLWYPALGSSLNMQSGVAVWFAAGGVQSATEHVPPESEMMVALTVMI